MKSKLLKTTIVAAATALSCAFAEADVTINSEFTLEDQRSGSGNFDFTAIGFTTTGTSTAVLSADGTASGDAIDTTKNNLYFTGGDLTLTDANLTAGTPTDGRLTTLYAFVVENGSVTFSGNDVQISELGLNLCIGTMFGSQDSTLNIVDGAQVKTSAYYSTVGSGTSKGTINISGAGSQLHTQQISLGGATAALTSAPEPETGGAGYYYPKYLISQEQYETATGIIKSKDNAAEGSRGEINISNGGQMLVGVGNTDFSNNKLQIMNGTLSVDGEGSSLILGENARFNVQGNYGTTSSFDNVISVTNGGSVKAEDGKTLDSVSLGTINDGSDVKTSVTVSGTDSEFNLTAEKAYISFGNGNGGTANLKIDATDGANFSLTGETSLVVAGETGGSKSNGQTVEISTSGGANVTLGGGNVVLGTGSSATGTENNVKITASGENSTLNIAATENVYINASNADNVAVDIIVEQSAAANISGETISVGDGANIVVSESATLATAGTVSVGDGSSITLDSTATWTSAGAIELESGSVLNLSVSLDQSAVVKTDALTIVDGAKINVEIDVSGLSQSDLASFTVSLITLTGNDYDSLDLDTLENATAVKFVSDGVDVSDSFAKDLSFDITSGSLVLSVPEPSAFGLCAGIAALALVAARRRRHHRMKKLKI